MLPEENKENHNVYIVFLITNTNMGKMIRFFTHNKYSHVTFTFDQDLQEMYSFARYHVDSPILGGFVIEKPERYLNNNNDVTVKICKIPVSKKEYQRINQEIAYFKVNKQEMIYNTLNAVLSLLKKRIILKNTYTCLEFITYLLHYPNMLEIHELERRLNKYVVYHGSMKDISGWEQSYEDADDYFQRRHVLGGIYDTAYHFKKIAKRLVSE